MSLHDAYARITPWELAFDDAERASELAVSVREEAEARGVDPHDLNGFLTLGVVEAFVRGVAGAADDPAALHRFGPLAFHGVHFTEAERPLFLATTHVARYLVGGVPDGTPEPPCQAGYLQLPQHLFWTRAADDAPESIDGIFWSVAPSGTLHTLVVTGIRPDRPGVGAVQLPAAPLADAARWLVVEAREGGDFETELPGAEIDALYGVETAGEVLKLLARFFAYVDAAPEALEERPAPREPRTGGPEEEEASGGDPDGPRPSALPFIRVSLEG